MESKSSTSKAGRPRCFCPDKALDRALEVFWRKGFDGTSLSDLTDAMGINRPSLYAAYGNKEALFRRALTRYGERAAMLLEEADRQPTARGFIETFLTAAVASFTDPSHPPGCFTLQGMGGSCGDHATLADDMNACRKGQSELFRQRFDRAVTAGELPADTDTAAVGAYFAVLVQGLAQQAAAGATAETLRQVIKTAMRAWPSENQKA